MITSNQNGQACSAFDPVTSADAGTAMTNDCVLAFKQKDEKRRHVFSCLAFHPEYVAAFLFLVIASIVCILYPAGAGLDEPQHIARAAQIANGHLLPEKIDRTEITASYYGLPETDYDLYGGSTDKAIYQLASTCLVNHDLMHGGNDANYIFPAWTDPQLKIDSRVGDGNVIWAFSNTSINSPIAYLPSSVAYKVLIQVTNNPWAVIVGMRLASVLTLSATIFFAVKLIPMGKWLLTSIFLLPQSIYVFSMVTADTMTMIGCVIFFTFLLRFLFKQETEILDWPGLLAGAIVVGLTKVTYMPFIFLIALIPLSNNKYANKQAIVKLASITFLGTLVFFIWYLQIKDVNTGAIWGDNINPNAQLNGILSNPIGFAKTLCRELIDADFIPLKVSNAGISTASNSIATIMLLCSIIADSLTNNIKIASLRIRIICSGIFTLWSLGIAVLICIALYLQFSPVGSPLITGVQPRYFIPTAFLSILGLIYMWMPISYNQDQCRVYPAIATCSCVISSLAHLASIICNIY